MKHGDNADREKDGQDQVMWRYCFTREKYQMIYKSAVGLCHFNVTLGAHYFKLQIVYFKQFFFRRL